MQINLFTCNAENERINKTNFIANRFVMAGTIKNSTSVIDPVIIIEKTNPSQYNYMYIEEFKRWYFINDIVNINNKIWEIHAHVDVLYTYYNDIANTQCIIDKSENFNNSNLYYDDGSIVMDCRKSIELKEFPNGFNTTGEYILICAGGV